MSSTFHVPKNLGLFHEYLLHNAEHSPDHPFFVYEFSNGGLRAINWSEAGVMFKRAAQIVASHLEEVLKESVNVHDPPIIGILANLDTISYHALCAGILLAGAVPFPISTRNSGASVAHLFKRTHSRAVYVSNDSAINDTVTWFLEDARNNGYEIRVLPTPTFQELSSEKTEQAPFYSLHDHRRYDLDTTAVVLHSSGSTSFPKPVFISHRLLIQWAKMTTISGFDLSNHRIAAHALPAFHGMGFFLLPWAACTGLTLAVFPPQVPPVVPSPRKLLEAALSTKCSFLICVPVFLELYSISTEDTSILRQFDAILFGGGPFDKTIGDKLAREGVPLIFRYGATEVGSGTVVMQPSKNSVGGASWDWFEVHPEIKLAFLPQPDSLGIFELVYLKNDLYSPAVINCQVDGVNGFATNDLVTLHPKNPSKFKIYGRKDDQITLSSGEKTNPSPIEAAICRHPFIASAMMFGRGELRNGIIIQPKQDCQIDPQDTVSLSQFKEAIWGTVEKANSSAPTHSRISKDMILISHPSKPLELTAKRTPSRAFTLERYKEEIKAIYEGTQISPLSDIPAPSLWNFFEVRDFVKLAVKGVLETDVAGDEDLFQRGCDSLQASQIRNILFHAISRIDQTIANRISRRFVYDHPTVNDLATQLLIPTMAANGDLVNDNASHQVKKMMDIITEFSAEFPKRGENSMVESFPGEVVLLTGSTGSLGTQLLYQLLLLPSVTHIYAINKPKQSKSLRQRQAEVLLDCDYEETLIDDPRVTLVEGDICVPGFGIDPKLLDEIHDTVDFIIHNAWTVNFNLSLGSFRPMIQSVRNLIEFSLLSPKKIIPRIIFTSSVGVFRNWSGNIKPLEEPIESPYISVGNGYSESKWISERILEEAAKRTPLRPIIVRIGQMTSNASGAWKTNNWLPIIIQSGQLLNVLPSRDESITWIPLDTAAKAILDFRFTDSQYLHLAHPQPVLWNAVFETFSSLLHVPLVSWNEWLAKLEKKSDEQDNSVAHLLEFFRDSRPTSSDKMRELGLPYLDLSKALEASPTLSSLTLGAVDDNDAKKWVNYWARKGILKFVEV